MIIRGVIAQQEFDAKVAEATRGFIECVDKENFYEDIMTGLRSNASERERINAAAAMAELRMCYHKLKFVEDFEQAYPAVARLQPVARVQHLKRGSTYQAFDASFQVSVPDEDVVAMVNTPDKARAVIDGDPVRVYVDEATMNMYVRFPDEFTEDRFKTL